MTFARRSPSPHKSMSRTSSSACLHLPLKSPYRNIFGIFLFQNFNPKEVVKMIVDYRPREVTVLDLKLPTKNWSFQPVTVAISQHPPTYLY